ncbi:MAG: orotate phosphoribosyltransferase [Capnocytophaga sp.]|nr:orotate phosphoribosyltransferase [Capnocytophaga sp.]
MIINSSTAEKTAEILLQIKAIKLNSENSFTWASGWKSPIYCDNRIVLSYPDIRTYIATEMANFVKNNYPEAEVVAGVATGAIGIGILVAERLGMPFVYVRPEPKKHGRQNQVEGLLAEGQKVVVIEDLISTGMSSLNAVRALRETPANVLGMVAIFSYGFDIAVTNFAAENVTLHTLGDYQHVLPQALKVGYISENELDTLKQWRENPAQWQQT